MFPTQILTLFSRDIYIFFNTLKGSRVGGKIGLLGVGLWVWKCSRCLIVHIPSRVSSHKVYFFCLFPYFLCVCFIIFCLFLFRFFVLCFVFAFALAAPEASMIDEPTAVFFFPGVRLPNNQSTSCVVSAQTCRRIRARRQCSRARTTRGKIYVWHVTHRKTWDTWGNLLFPIFLVWHSSSKKADIDAINNLYQQQKVSRFLWGSTDQRATMIECYL